MKKLFCMALALCMIFALAACGQNADPDASPTPTNYEGVTPSDLLTTPHPTRTPEQQPLENLSVGGVDLVSDGVRGNLGYEGFEYADGVLTITDVTVQTETGSFPVIAFDGGDLEIVISGEVTLAAENGASAISGGDNNLTISGDGTLKVTASGEAAAIDVTGGVSISCSVTASGSDACTSGNITAGEGFSLTDNGAELSVAAAAA